MATLFNKKFNEMKENLQNKKVLIQTQNKRDQLLKSVKVEIDKKKNEINMLYMEMGEKIYQDFVKNNMISSDNPDVAKDLENLNQRHVELETLNLKYDDIDKKYTEELEILSGSVSDTKAMDASQVATSQQSNVVQNTASSSGNVVASFCSNCGTKRENDNMFCSNCGNKF